MDTEKIWKEGEWTNEARQILDGLKKFPNNSKVILLLRHSHRNELNGLEGAQKLKLLRDSARIYLQADLSIFSIALYGDAKKQLKIYMKGLKILVEQVK